MSRWREGEHMSRDRGKADDRGTKVDREEEIERKMEGNIEWDIDGDIE